MGGIGFDWVRSLGDLVARVEVVTVVGSLALFLAEQRRRARPRWLGFWIGFALGNASAASGWFVIERVLL